MPKKHPRRFIALLVFMLATLLLCGCTISLKYDSRGSMANVSPSPVLILPGQSDIEQGYVYCLTKGYYSELKAMEGAVLEYGKDAQIADWNDIKPLCGSDADAFLSSVGALSNEDIWVTYCGGEFDGTRHYFLAYIDGSPRSDFLKYDDMGDEAWLGSWYGINLRVFVKIPA